MQTVLYWQTHTVRMVISSALRWGGTRTQQRRKYVRHVGQTICKHKMLLYLPLFTLPSSVLRFLYDLLLTALRYSFKNVLAHVEIIVVKVKLILHVMIIFLQRLLFHHKMKIRQILYYLLVSLRVILLVSTCPISVHLRRMPSEI
jgi:hypothetical protein